MPRNFDTTKDVVLQADASQWSLDIVLLQDRKPAAYASKAVPPAGTWYANIERKMLATIFWSLKYHHYLYGKKFVGKSDHQPLENVKCPFENLLDEQLTLQKLLPKVHHVILKVYSRQRGSIYRCTQQSQPSWKDADERSWPHHIWNNSIHDTGADIHGVWWKEEGCNNAVYWSKQMLQGWPSHYKGVDPALSKYWALREDLNIEDGSIVSIGRLIILLI